MCMWNYNGTIKDGFEPNTKRFFENQFFYIYPNFIRDHRPKHGIYCFTYYLVCSNICQWWLHDYVVRLNISLVAYLSYK
jgi:hypothetical protein